MNTKIGGGSSGEESWDFCIYNYNIDRVITGNPLALYITDENEKQQCIRDLEIALKADVIQLNNGDYILIIRWARILLMEWDRVLWTIR